MRLDLRAIYNGGNGKEIITVGSIDLMENGTYIVNGEYPIGVDGIISKTPHKDKNGEEVWEGDILGLDDPEDNSKCVVVFHNGSFCRSYVPYLSKRVLRGKDFFEKDWIHVWGSIDTEMWKVIGSIHDNK